LIRAFPPKAEAVVLLISPIKVQPSAIVFDGLAFGLVAIVFIGFAVGVGVIILVVFAVGVGVIVFGCFAVGVEAIFVWLGLTNGLDSGDSVTASLGFALNPQVIPVKTIVAAPTIITARFKFFYLLFELSVAYPWEQFLVD
jgi:hypothetical protein